MRTWCGSREEEYLEVAKRYTPAELNLHFPGNGYDDPRNRGEAIHGRPKPVLHRLCDIFQKQARREFYTPPELSKLMARMLLDVDAAKAAGKPVDFPRPEEIEMRRFGRATTDTELVRPRL